MGAHRSMYIAIEFMIVSIGKNIKSECQAMQKYCIC
jgi:hypothetical protein